MNQYNTDPQQDDEPIWEYVSGVLSQQLDEYALNLQALSDTVVYSAATQPYHTPVGGPATNGHRLSLLVELNQPPEPPFDKSDRRFATLLATLRSNQLGAANLQLVMGVDSLDPNRSPYIIVRYIHTDDPTQNGYFQLIRGAEGWILIPGLERPASRVVPRRQQDKVNIIKDDDEAALLDLTNDPRSQPEICLAAGLATALRHKINRHL